MMHGVFFNRFEASLFKVNALGDRIKQAEVNLSAVIPIYTIHDNQ